MNLIHMKYAVEISRQGSLNKAADALFIAQPNLSRSIKELENELGISIFTRTSKGMELTPEGSKFIGYAKKILRSIDEVENMYKTGAPENQHFSISVPRATYISDAFARFTSSLSDSPANIFYKETNSQRAIKNILEVDYKLGILRYAANYDSYFKSLFEEKKLSAEVVAEFTYGLVVSKNSPLTEKKTIHYEDLKDFIEIAHADPYVPSLSLSEVKKEELPDNISRRIFVFERGSELEILSENPNTFMWVSPFTKKMLERYDLVQLKCPDNTRLYRDVLIHKNDYVLTDLDKMFITELCRSKRECF